MSRIFVSQGIHNFKGYRLGRRTIAHQQWNAITLTCDFGPHQRFAREVGYHVAEAAVGLPGHGFGGGEDIVVNGQGGSHGGPASNIKHQASSINMAMWDWISSQFIVRFAQGFFSATR